MSITEPRDLGRIFDLIQRLILGSKRGELESRSRNFRELWVPLLAADLEIISSRWPIVTFVICGNGWWRVLGPTLYFYKNIKKKPTRSVKFYSAVKKNKKLFKKCVTKKASKQSLFIFFRLLLHALMAEFTFLCVFRVHWLFWSVYSVAMSFSLRVRLCNGHVLLVTCLFFALYLVYSLPFPLPDKPVNIFCYR